MDCPSMPRKRVNISIDEKLLTQIDDLIGKGYTYKDRSHFLEVAAAELLKKGEKV